MTFTSLIPASGQSLGFTKQKIQDNFTNYFNVMSINHVAPNASGEGKHKFVQMPQQVAAPSTAVNEIALYSKDSTIGTALFFRQESNGTEVQLTGLDPIIATEGCSFLPGGLLIQWGSIASTSTHPNEVTFPVAFSTVIYSIQVTPFKTVAGGSVPFSVYYTLSAMSPLAKFNINTIQTVTTTIGFNWIAIGI